MLRKSKPRKETRFNLNDQDFSLKPINKKKHIKRETNSSMAWLDESDIDEEEIKNIFDFFRIGEV